MEDCVKVRLKTLNAQITCYICKGYLIDATTVLDCLHTFCKSCLLRHFDNSARCPRCEILIHQSHPAHYVSIDRTMQDLVYKLVPAVQRKERERREKFIAKRGLTLDAVRSESFPMDEESKPVENGIKDDPDSDYHRSDEQVNLHLCTVDQMKQLKRQYLRVSEHATVTHIKKYLAAKLFFNPDRFMDFDILCNEELMGKDHSLKFIQRTRWRNRADQPLELHYTQHVEF